MMYDFYCPNCGSQSSLFIRMKDYDTEKDKQKCSNCGSTLKRRIEFSGLMSSPGFGTTNNGGWHV